MRQTSIDQQEISWAGIDLKEGLASGESIKEGQSAPAWSVKPTGMGKLVRVYNPDRSGTMTLTVDQESATHQTLIAIAEADRLTRNQVFPMLWEDKASGMTTFYLNAFIASEPEEARGTESNTFPWVFHFESKQVIPSAGTKNIVGK